MIQTVDGAWVMDPAPSRTSPFECASTRSAPSPEALCDDQTPTLPPGRVGIYSSLGRRQTDTSFSTDASRRYNATSRVVGDPRDACLGAVNPAVEW